LIPSISLRKARHIYEIDNVRYELRLDVRVCLISIQPIRALQNQPADWSGYAAEMAENMTSKQLETVGSIIINLVFDNRN
jgi:hypothetical protein